MNVFLLPPEKHFDRGLGMTASEFKQSADKLKGSKGMALVHLPVCYLQRHSIELYLKSLIFILHKKFKISFGDGFSIDKPGVLINGKWKPLSNTHNLANLYSYFIDLFQSVIHLMPTSTDWTIDPKIITNINLINGYDPNSTYFRYPKSLDEKRDRMKSEVQLTDIESTIAQANSPEGKPVKCLVMLNEHNEVVETYDLSSSAITDVRNALDETIEFLDGIHSAFLGELTGWT